MKKKTKIVGLFLMITLLFFAIPGFGKVQASREDDVFDGWQELEDEAGKPHAAPVETDQVSLEALSESAVIDQLRRAQVDTLSPLEALNLLYELKNKLQ